MIIDATFWVAISFVLFIGLIIYFKVPQKIKNAMDENITNIKNQIQEAEKLKEEAKNLLSENEKKISDSKSEIEKMIEKANSDAEKNILRVNSDFHRMVENRKKSTEEKIKQMKNQTLKDVKNASVKIALESAENLLKNSLDKAKLDNLYISSLEETKLALKKKSS
tara:strand:+ start:185 stop:682 length:498 start_codon:yes stop_codon:yes gene_type:complete